MQKQSKKYKKMKDKKEAEMRDSFVIYRSFVESFEGLPDDVELSVYRAISYYCLNDVVPELKGMAKSIFTLIKPQLDANNTRFENGKKGAEHGKKGGRPKGTKNPKETPKKPLENPIGVICENPKETPNVNVNVNVNDSILDSYESNNCDFKKKSVDKFVLPDGIRPDVWTAFVAMRVKIKRPLTEQAKNLIFKKLVNINQDTGQDPNEILEASIMHSWQGVFPLKTKSEKVLNYDKYNQGQKETSNSSFIKSMQNQGRERKRNNPHNKI